MSADGGHLQESLRLILIVRDGERELLLTRSAQSAVLALEPERAEQRHVVVHVRKLGGPQHSPVSAPIAVNAQYLSGEEYGVEAVMRHGGSLATPDAPDSPLDQDAPVSRPGT